jgi:hypothetical protein
MKAFTESGIKACIKSGITTLKIRYVYYCLLSKIHPKFTKIFTGGELPFEFFIATLPNNKN